MVLGVFLKVVHLGTGTLILVLGKVPGWRFIFDLLRLQSLSYIYAMVGAQSVKRGMYLSVSQCSTCILLFDLHASVVCDVKE
jgi:hypothetical protein